MAIDEAHLIYSQQKFRKTYRCYEDVHTIFPDVPVMASSAIITPQVWTALTTFLNDPVIENSSVNRN